MNVARLLLTLALLTATLGANATLRMSPDGITPDTSRSGLRRGAETLHPVRIDRHWIEESVGLGGLWLPSTGAAPVLARFTRTMTSQQDGNWTWVGKIDTRIGEQSVILTFGDHAVFGTIPQPNGYPLRIETRHGQTWLVEGTLPPKILPHGQSDGLIAPVSTSKMAARTTQSITGQSSIGTVRAATAAPTVIDVLVAYTPSVVTYYGSDSAARTHFDFLASVANQSYADSSVNQQIRIVSKQLLNYTTANDNSVLLDLITNPSADPVKTQIDSWRSQYGADLVSVVRAFDNSTQTNCGLAWIGGYHGSPYDSTHGFSVVGDGANGGFYCTDQTFAHELGHNMGGQHDYTTASGDYGAYTYSRGFRQTIDANTGFATVMAYSVDPQVVLSLFSNPDINNCMGQPCGVADSDPQAADNAHTLNNSAASIAAYFSTVVPVLPTLSIADVAISEGNSGTKVATFTVKLSAQYDAPVTYDIATSNNTATAGSDYVANSLVSQSIAAGQTSKTFSVTINGDATVEPNETFFVRLSNPSNATLVDSSATGTINNDDGPALSIADVSVTEGNSGTKTATFTVQLSAASGSPVTYNITTANGSATAGSDFVASTLSGQSIPAGQTSKTFSVTVNGDAAIEPNETFTVTATSVTGATVTDGVGVGVGTIINDDGPTLSIGDVSISEGNSGQKNLVFTVTMSTASATTVTYDIKTANNTATAFDFYAAPLNGESIYPGQTSRTYTVLITGDHAVETNETFFVIISNASGASIADNIAIGTIINDDTGQPNLAIDRSLRVSEGNNGTSVATFTVRLSGPASTAVTYDIATADGAATAGSDYVANTLIGQSIPAGQTSKTFSVIINGDTILEPDEYFIVNVSNVAGAVVAAGDGQGTGVIVNDDLPAISIGDVSISEGNSGSKLMTFTVSLSTHSYVDVTYNIATADASAKAGIDYTATSLNGQVIRDTQTFTVPILGDTTVEGNKSFLVNLSSVSGATIADGQANGIILNDDGPTLSIGDIATAEGNSGTTLATFTVRLSQAAAVPVTYNIATANGGANAGVDYVANTLIGESIPAGQTSKTFTVSLNGDTTLEQNETYYANLSAASGATILDSTAIGYIVNDDGPTLSINDAAITEGNSGTQLLTFTVTLSQAATTAVTYNLATANVTATAGSDYVAVPLTAQSIPAGQLNKTFSVTINGDTTIEPNETFYLNLSSPVGATKFDGTGVGTITNDD